MAVLRTKRPFAAGRHLMTALMTAKRDGTAAQMASVGPQISTAMVAAVGREDAFATSHRRL